MADWYAHAACRGTDLALWFDHHRTAECAMICARCPVVEECLDEALALEVGETPHGFRGGLTAVQRRRDRKVLRARRVASRTAQIDRQGGRSMPPLP
ncbi:MAG: WhiB family transcriptional regulator [Actinobacteria bacterium]|nr:WhiB family transcriptional regulator [Actinomycetota bacterium]